MSDLEATVERDWRYNVHPSPLWYIPGFPVGVRFIAPENPLDIREMEKMERSNRLAEFIEDIHPDRPDPPKVLRANAASMRYPESGQNCLRYAVVANEASSKKGIGIWEGKLIGNVVFFPDDPERIKQLKLDGKTTNTMYLELSFYEIDNMYRQFPELRKAWVADEHGKRKLTPFTAGVLTAMVHLTTLLEETGIPLDQVVVVGYIDKRNALSISALCGGVQKVGEIKQYDADYIYPHDVYQLDWKKVKELYTDLALEKDRSVSPEVFVSVPVHNPLNIPFNRLKEKK